MNITYNPESEAERAIVAKVNQLFEEAEAEIEKHQAPGPDDVSAIDEELGGLTVETFRENVGDGSWEFVKLAAQHFGPDEEFGFEELSSRSGEPVEALKAYHRNLGRTARMLGGRISDLIPAHWDGSRGWYRIPPELHAEASR
jgi:hypothetical protein